MSSGTIGYAAYFGKPVIGPSDGLLGKLITKNKLGYCIDSISPTRIKETFLKEFYIDGEKYCSTHIVNEFCKTLLFSYV